jgi:predicted transcriptional regulator
MWQRRVLLSEVQMMISQTKDRLSRLQKEFLADCEEFKAVILSQPQLDLFRWIALETHGCGSPQVAAIFGISLQSASARLKKLFDKGYLTRKEVAAETGGIEFIYKAKS